MIAPGSYIVDSDVFISAKNSYYAFGFCPGFWDGVLHHHAHDRVFSIDRVRAELLSGSPQEDLVLWVKQHVPATFFLETGAREVVEAYQAVMLWAQRHGRFSDAAKAKFATGADGWLVALGQVHGAVVVTNEVSEPESRKSIKIPDVCIQFGVDYVNTFEMLGAVPGALVFEDAS